ncbi:ATP-grasp domain-containing protein [Xanthomonas axonopodis pv. poinsettiicola]|uniref:ATP-grasp domain-containing protein n=1 Tax=Xanthomonas TaxID=338 RepID=UPI001E34FC43|nr:ATP-grasp domain-containing protein [Xanthomonas codiaei]MCC8535567.1 ATP-grasp domain-containing protein [Xanthomonas codiaei]
MSLPHARVWFNRHYATIARIIDHLRGEAEPLPIWTCVSHRQENFRGFARADHALLEPAGLSPEAYLQWCYQVVQQLQITHLVPGYEQSLLTSHRAEFAALGCQIVHAAPADILPNLHHKQWVYAAVAGLVPLPDYRYVTTLQQAVEAIAQLGVDGAVCVKPTVSVYGKGFYRLVEGIEPSTYACSAQEWIGRMERLPEFEPHLVMRYLPGVEYSVDIAARDGDVLACVVRQKDPNSKVQQLSMRADLVGYATAMVKRFGANGLINVQFKDDIDGAPMLLEINPRAAGGIGMSCMSGINLPHVAYRACIFPELPVQIPTPRLGIRVTEISLAVELPDAQPLPGTVMPQVAVDA